MPFHLQAAFGQFKSQTGLIRRLQEARPQSAVHLNSGADNALSDPVQILPFCHLCALSDLGGKHLREADFTPDPGLMLALVDSLHAGTLNEAQREAARALRTGILALVEQDVDVV